MKKLIGEKINVLDHGYVILVDYMGSDQDIVDAARVSYNSGVKKHDTRGLIRYLLRHSHTSPFEMCELKFQIKLPIFVARQWIRHRTASVNEVSGRYSVLPDENYLPKTFSIQSAINKQGSGENVDSIINMLLKGGTEKTFAHCRSQYDLLLEHNVAKEQARIVLPLSQYTEWVWKIDLHNLLHFLKLRLDPHAQEEIRQYATIIAGIVEELFPETWQAFVDYKLSSVTFSFPEQRLLQNLLTNYAKTSSGGFIGFQLMEADVSATGLSQREVDEFTEKFSRAFGANICVDRATKNNGDVVGAN